jgi:hypothetical protein
LGQEEEGTEAGEVARQVPVAEGSLGPDQGTDEEGNDEAPDLLRVHASRQLRCHATVARRMGGIAFASSGVEVSMFKLPTLLGLLLVLGGTAIVLKQVLHLDLPLFRVACGLLFVWTGLSLLSQAFGLSIPAPLAWDDHNLVLSHGDMNADGERELNVIFSNGTIDLRTAHARVPTVPVEINTVFGNTTILYDPSAPLYVDASSAFGRMELPNHDTFAFGDRMWQSAGYDASRPALRVKATSVFGSCHFVAAGEASDTVRAATPIR